jgi:hypothetical protein
MKSSGGAHASRVQIRASRPNRWLNHLVWKTNFRRDAENGGRDGRAPHESGIATRRRRNWPCPVGESAAPAFGGLGPGFSHGARPKPPPVAAGCGARGRHKVHTGQVPLGAAWLQQPAEKKLRAGVAWPSPAAGAGGVSPPVPSPGGTPGQPAGGTPALQGSRRTMPRRRRWKQRRFS